jgi:hypothetical protein
MGIKTFVPVLVFALIFTACYDAPPPRVPRPELPPMQQGASILVDTREKLELRKRGEEACSTGAGGRIDCVKYKVNEPVMVTHARATYNGRSLTLGQAQGLTDPEYLQDIDAIANHIEGCKRAKIPRIAGELFWLVGSIVFVDAYANNSSQPDKTLAVTGGALIGAGLVSYALGKYVLGGQHCEAANDLYRSRENQFRDRDDTDVTGRNAAILEEAAKRFNAKHGGNDPSP